MAENTNANLSYQLLFTEQDFVSLEAEWHELYERLPERAYTTSFDWNYLCLKHARKLYKGSLCLLVVRQKEQLVLLFPFLRNRNWYGLRQALPLAVYSTEYSLVLYDPNAGNLLVEALSYLQKQGVFDVLRLPYVTVDSPLFEAAKCLGALAHSPMANPFLRTEMFSDYGAYLASRSPKLRQNLRRCRLRLEESASLRVELTTKEAERTALLQWMVQGKMAWVKNKGLRHTHLNESYLNLMQEAILSKTEANNFLLAAIYHNHHVIACRLMRRNSHTLEFVLTHIDPAYQKYSPIQLLNDYCIRLAMEQSLQVDFRIGAGVHKEVWCNETHQLVTLTLDSGRYARMLSMLRKLRLRFRKLVPFGCFGSNRNVNYVRICALRANG